VDPIPRDTWEAYFRTLYWIEAPGERLCLRVGEPSPDLDRLLQRHAVREAAYVTAWNPFSRVRSEPENAARQREFVEEVRAQWQVLPGAGVGEDEAWKEPSLLILGIPRGDAMALGRRWEQNAILVAEAGRPVELVALRPVAAPKG